MIEGRTIALEYIKKEEFYGSFQGMRYRLSKGVSKDDEERKMILEAWIWPEPYSFIKTPNEKKEYASFPLTEEGKEEAVSWLNKRYDEEKEKWKNSISLWHSAE